MAYMVEVYCSKINDLGARAMGEKEKDIKVKQTPDGRVFLDGVMERECKTAKDLFKLLDDGNKAKKVTATAMNPDSSRSHSILSLVISVTSRDTQKVHFGKILLVDLAGS